MPPTLELLYGSLATTGRGLSEGGSLEEQQVQLIAEYNLTHAWECDPKRVCTWKHGAEETLTSIGQIFRANSAGSGQMNRAMTRMARAAGVSL